MLETTLCYLYRDQKILMLYRNRKKEDVNEGKWVGIGGKRKAGETPEQCMLREFEEETGLVPTAYEYRGIVLFTSEGWEEKMHLFTATDAVGTIHACTEGTLAWIEQEEVQQLPIWEGDRVFFSLLEEQHPFFLLHLFYQGENLVHAELDGKQLF